MKKSLLFLLGIAAVGGGLYYCYYGTGVQPLSEKTLKFAEVRQVTIRDTIGATGLVEPREVVIVSSESPGMLVRLSGRIGDSVTEGDVLAQLDDRLIVLKIEEANTGVKLAAAASLQAEAALTQASASKDAAERAVKVQLDLEKAGGFRTEREQAEAHFKAALAGIKVAQAGIEVAHAKKQAANTALKEAELARDMTRVKVPGLSHLSPGNAKREFLILDRKVSEGQMVGPQAGPMFMLAGSLDIVEVHAQVVEGDVNRIRKGLAALFKIKDYNDEDTEFQGVIKEIRPLASNIKGAVYYDTVIEVKNRKDPTTGEWQLRPGMTANLDLVRVEHKNAWQVPSDALNVKLDEAYQSDAVKAHLAKWKSRPDAKDWHPLWVWDESAQQPQAIMIRIGPKPGEVGLKDGEGNEILEWEPGRQPTGPLRVIIYAPPARAPGFLDQPANVKI